MSRPFEVLKLREGIYLIFRKCSCGKETRAKVASQALWDYEHGAKVQDAFPEVPAADREALFMTGICPACWEKLFAPEAEEAAELD